MNQFQFEDKLWQYDEPGGWHFITVPEMISLEVKELYSDMSPGFGSIAVHVTVGQTKWQTSMFFDTKHKAYLLPIKGEIRKKEKLTSGDLVNLSLEIIV